MPEKYFARKSSIAGIAEVSHKDLLIYMYIFHISTKQRPQQTLKVAKWNNKIRVYDNPTEWTLLEWITYNGTCITRGYSLHTTLHHSTMTLLHSTSFYNGSTYNSTSPTELFQFAPLCISTCLYIPGFSIADSKESLWTWGSFQK